MHTVGFEPIISASERMYTHALDRATAGIGRVNRFFFVALRPNAGHDLLILEVSRSHTTTHHSR